MRWGSFVQEDLKSHRPGFMSHVCHFLAVGVWARHRFSLSLRITATVLGY